MIRVGPSELYALNKLDGHPCPECGILYTLKGSISKAFFKGVINKFSFKVFSFNSWNITIQVLFKGSISFNLWNNPHFKRPVIDVNYACVLVRFRCVFITELHDSHSYSLILR